METLQIIQACTAEHFAALSRIHALSWRSAYRGLLPQRFLEQEITEDRWIPFFQSGFQKGTHQGLLLLRNGEPVCSGSFGPARLDCQDGSLCAFDNSAFLGYGEIISLYTLPGETGKGYGSLLLEEMTARLEREGRPGCLLYVLRENGRARDFYEKHRFRWTGEAIDVPLPGTVCVDLRYLRTFSGRECL